jgi:hypothetical protein
MTRGGGVLWSTACGNGSKEAFKYCPHCGGIIVKEKEPVFENQLSLIMGQEDKP